MDKTKLEDIMWSALINDDSNEMLPMAVRDDIRAKVVQSGKRGFRENTYLGGMIQLFAHQIETAIEAWIVFDNMGNPVEVQETSTDVVYQTVKKSGFKVAKKRMFAAGIEQPKTGKLEGFFAGPTEELAELLRNSPRADEGVAIIMELGDDDHDDKELFHWNSETFEWDSSIQNPRDITF